MAGLTKGDDVPSSSANPSDDQIASDLYRPSALAEASSRFGSPVRPTGVAGWVLTGFMTILFIAIVLFLVVGRYTRKETVSGVVQPSAGAVRVTALTAGVVSEVRVSDGQIVKTGDPILIMSSDRSVTEGGAAASSMSDLLRVGTEKEAVALLDQAQAQSEGHARSLDDLNAQREGLIADQAQLSENLVLQQDRVRLASETLEAGRSLHERSLFSTLQLRQREEALIAARQGVAAIERERRRNEASLRQLAAEQGRVRAEARASTATAALAGAQLEQRRVQNTSARGFVLTAARSGRVVALAARPGAPVEPGRALAIIIPENGRFQAELWAPSRAAGFVRAGDRVRIMYDAFPYQKFGVGRGVVVSVAGAPTDPADLPIPIETKEALYRVVVELESGTMRGYERQWQLAPGMRLSADLVLDDRSLWEWLFDPIIAARRRSER